MSLEIGTVLALERKLAEMEQDFRHAREPNGFALRLQRFAFSVERRLNCSVMSTQRLFLFFPLVCDREGKSFHLYTCNMKTGCSSYWDC